MPGKYTYFSYLLNNFKEKAKETGCAKLTVTKHTIHNFL